MGIRGVRLKDLRVDAKFYDDANPVEHRGRVIGSNPSATDRVAHQS